MVHIEEFVLAAAAALLAGFIRGFSGFGGPAVLTLLLLPFYPPMLVVPKVVVVDLLGNLHLIPNIVREPAWRRVMPWFAVAMLAVPFGHWLVLDADPETVRIGVGVLAAVSAAAMLCGWRLTRIPPPAIGLVVSFASGLLMGGVYIALTMMIFIFSLPQGAADSRAQAIVWAFSTGLVLAVAQLISGAFGADSVLPAAVMAVAYLGGATVGSHCFGLASEKTVRRAVLWLLVALAMLVIVT